MHSPAHYAKGTPSPNSLAGIGLRPLVSVWFQVLLTQLIAVLFIVQSPYWFTIGHQVVFSLGRWSGRIHARFHESRATLVRLSTPISRLRLRGFHPLWPDFPDGSTDVISARGARNPGTNPGLGYFRFRSPLLTESMSVSFPPGT